VAFFLRSESQNLPVILTSGYPVSNWSAGDTADLQRLGSRSVEIIEKPFPARALLELVENLLGASPSESATASGENT
jgi:hypothetical protein